MLDRTEGANPEDSRGFGMPDDARRAVAYLVAHHQRGLSSKTDARQPALGLAI